MWFYLFLLFIFHVKEIKSTCNSIENRIDCYPSVYGKPNVTEELCLAQGCCWNASSTDIPCSFGAKPVPSNEMCQAISIPHRIHCRNPHFNTLSMTSKTCAQMGCCYHSTKTDGEPSCYQPWIGGYTLIKMNETEYGWKGVLSILPNSNIGPFGNDINTLEIEIWYEKNYRLRMRFTDPNHDRYEVQNIVQDSQRPLKKAASIMYDVSFTKYPFGVAITRKTTGQVLFNSTPSALEHGPTFNGLIYANQFLEISTHLFTKHSKPTILGLGEQVSPLKLETDGKIGQHYTFFARDQLAGWAKHLPKGGENVYGVHPFYIEMEDTGDAHGVFFLNSNAMEFVLDNKSLTMRSVGGILDIFIFMGSSPHDISKQYTELIGKPILPPYWSLGFHLCRWGYGDVHHTRLIVERLRAAGVPQDGQWNDIDYMDHYAIFTLNEKTFPHKQMRAFIEDMHNHDQYYINIHDPGVSIQYTGTANFTAYQRAQDMNVIVRNRFNESLIGKVWPGWVVYPDFYHPNATEFWYKELKKFHDIIPFDGMWIDMNEPSNFCDGERPFNCRSVGPEIAVLPPDFQPNLSPQYIKSPDVNYPFDPFRQPYVPGQIEPNAGGKGDLDSQTIAMSAKQYSSLHYNLHSLYGHSELIASMKAMEKIRKKRSLVLSRGTYAGSGRHGMHWLGDSFSTWANLRDSISGILAMNIFGIPFVGADVCGFLGNTNRELCIRWQQVGAFYPFFRNHNHIDAIPQSPIDFDHTTNEIIKQTILHRYRLLPTLYTLFYHAHIQGLTVTRPLIFEFPKDRMASSTQEQFMWGSSLLITPVLYPGKTKVKGYFPQATWYDYWNGKLLTSSHSSPKWMELDASLDSINVHVRGGNILILQEESLTTTASKKNPYGLIIAMPLEKKEYAIGDLYLDDGDSLNVIEKNEYCYIKFKSSWEDEKFFNLLVQNIVVHDGYSNKTSIPPLNTIRFYGIQDKSFEKNVYVSIVYPKNERKKISLKSITHHYDSSKQVLSLYHLNLDVSTDFILRITSSLKIDKKLKKKNIFYPSLAVHGHSDLFAKKTLVIEKHNPMMILIGSCSVVIGIMLISYVVNPWKWFSKQRASKAGYEEI